MKNGQVIKSTDQTALSEEMALINSYSRRELSAEEVYIFSVVLCDNDIDRDCERFTVESLYALEKLFVGKTGIMDHEPTAKNQKARIISCRTESVDGAVTAQGDQLFRLTARAYMRRTEGNRELIEAIESGIVKEVSVGCRMGHTLCSICHNDMHSPLCTHQKGAEYDGMLCFGELTEPRDAYEFSFVAVPAQRGAGVIKSVKEKDMNEICKALECEREVTLSKGEADRLREYIAGLRQDSECVEAYRSELTGKLHRTLRDRGVLLDHSTEESILKKLSLSEALAVYRALSKKEQRVVPQLCSSPAEKAPGNTEFRI